MSARFSAFMRGIGVAALLVACFIPNAIDWWRLPAFCALAFLLSIAFDLARIAGRKP